MDTNSETTQSTQPPLERAGGPLQPTLPFGPVPFNDETDEPVGFRLTARALRTVAPHEVAHLTVVACDADPDDRSDTRPARARALRRAGLAFDDIASAVGADELLIRAWVDGVVVRKPAAGTSAPARRLHAVDPTAASSDEHLRATARDDAARRLACDPQFAAGVGLLAGVATFDRHAVTITTHSSAVAAKIVRWLIESARCESSRVRVVLRLGPAATGDRMRAQWSHALGLEASAIGLARWREAPELDSCQAMIRVGDPSLAQTLAGWCDALMAIAEHEPVDVAF